MPPGPNTILVTGDMLQITVPPPAIAGPGRDASQQRHARREALCKRESSSGIMLSFPAIVPAPA